MLQHLSNSLALFFRTFLLQYRSKTIVCDMINAFAAIASSSEGLVHQQNGRENKSGKTPERIYFLFVNAAQNEQARLCACLSNKVGVLFGKIIAYYNKGGCDPDASRHPGLSQCILEQTGQSTHKNRFASIS